MALLFFQVFGAAARRQAQVIGLTTWDEYTGTGEDSGATDASRESGVARSATDDETDLSRVSLEAALEAATAIDESEVYISPADIRTVTAAGVVHGRAPGVRLSAAAASAATYAPPADWQASDASILGRRVERALNLSSRDSSSGGLSLDEAVDAGDAISFADGISAVLEYSAFVLLHGERSLTLTEAFTLWREVVSAVLTPSERTRGLAWFTQVRIAHPLFPCSC